MIFFFLPRAYLGAGYWIYNLYHPCKKLITTVGRSFIETLSESTPSSFQPGFHLSIKKRLLREGAQAGDFMACSYFEKLILGTGNEGAMCSSCFVCLTRLPEARAGDPCANAHSFLPEQDVGAHVCKLPSSTDPG